MAWSEIVGQRNRNSRTYADGALRHWSGRMAALHCESALDSGVYDAPIDCTPQRINNAQLDGWIVTQNGWHYALGKPLDGALAGQDGVVGFGGRKGQNWLRFRLMRLGYLHWPTRAWQDVGGPPQYLRAGGRLAQQVNTATIGPNNEALPIESVANWAGLWSTPGGGDVSASWRVHGGGLKEEITVNQAAREWVTINRPPLTPAADTYFGMIFRVDWSDIPRAYRAGVLQDAINGDFADDGESLELRDALDRLLALMPIDYAYVQSGRVRHSIPLRKRFWHDPDGNTYLLVGARVDQLAALPAGDLIFDPTINEQVGAGSDDGFSIDSGGRTPTITGNVEIGENGGNLISGFRATTVNIAQGTTIDSATITLTSADTYDGPAMTVKVACEAADNAATITTEVDNLYSRLRTAYSTDWDINNLVLNIEYSQIITAQVQAVINRAGFTANNAIMVLVVNSTCPFYEWQVIWGYDNSAAKAAKLDIVYTAAGGSVASKSFMRPMGIIY